MHLNVDVLQEDFLLKKMSINWFFLQFPRCKSKKFVEYLKKNTTYLIATGCTNGDKWGNCKPPGGGANRGKGKAGLAVIFTFLKSPIQLFMLYFYHLNTFSFYFFFHCIWSTFITLHWISHKYCKNCHTCVYVQTRPSTDVGWFILFW